MNETLTNEDAQLLQRIARQDRPAFSKFYDRYAGVLHATALRILRNPEDAAEVLKEVFLQVWEDASTFDPELSSPFHWVVALTRKKAIGRLQAFDARYKFIDETNQETAGLPERPPSADEFPGRERRARIRAVVESLPLEQRQALEMAFLGGMAQNEIVETLNQPPPIIKARIRRGLLTLREGLKGNL